MHLDPHWELHLVIHWVPHWVPHWDCHLGFVWVHLLGLLRVSHLVSQLDSCLEMQRGWTLGECLEPGYQ